MAQDGIHRYAYNLFAFPKDYFEKHTADELGITEDERQDLIKIKRECEERKASFDANVYEKSQAKTLEDFEKDFFAD